MCGVFVLGSEARVAQDPDILNLFAEAFYVYIGYSFRRERLGGENTGYMCCDAGYVCASLVTIEGLEGDIAAGVRLHVWKGTSDGRETGSIFIHEITN